MKRNIALTLVLSVFFAGLAFGQVKAKDGIYFAQDDQFAKDSGWKEEVILTVKGGKITTAIWNGVSNAGVADKLTVVAAGGYPMVKAGKAKAEWDAQAKTVQDYLVKTQDVAFNKYSDAEGRTDAISGASIHVKAFFGLVAKALASPAVPKGIYKKDGWFFQAQSDFDAKTGWKDSVLVTVVNGTIVDVLWNGVSNDKTKKSKLVTDLAGGYGMEKAAKKGAWNVQAKAVQDAIIKAQDPALIALKADGTTDAISGASIHPTAVSLAVEALKAAR
jgi:major membrane immunogen (membrane-anchored lipoprotein)